jgi:hypothetical protein
MGVLINVFSVLAGGGLNRTLPRPQSVEPFFQVTIPEVCDSFFYLLYHFVVISER